MRVPSLFLVIGLLSSCDGWPGDPLEDQPAPPLPPPGPRDAGTNCTALTALLSAASPQVNGAFCFGVASGASEFLACAPVNASEVECADQALGSAYVVQWTGGTGQVRLARGGAAVATLSQRAPGAFELDSSVVPAGLCRFAAGLAEFCTFVP
jgi:hypothetical protein